MGRGRVFWTLLVLGCWDGFFSSCLCLGYDRRSLSDYDGILVLIAICFWVSRMSKMPPWERSYQRVVVPAPARVRSPVHVVPSWAAVVVGVRKSE
ncbi:hypothetical protein VTK73DRAFT_3667 [Phialemonium thermophilum]|uniref:Secreted protein n=1 Tax=Phialemonium thermophilum TaxID=223376 RepID=A0ABR3VI52_9PEZI